MPLHQELKSLLGRVQADLVTYCGNPSPILIPEIVAINGQELEALLGSEPPKQVYLK